MRRISIVSLLALLLCSTSPRLDAQSAAPGAMRVLVVVDSSSSVAPLLNPFRAALQALMAAVPPDAEVAMVSTGGQLRVRLTPTADRERWMAQAKGFAQDGGANALVDTLLEADRRFLRNSERRQVIVLLTTDGNEMRDEARLDDYNRFVRDFLNRGGRAHGIVLRSARLNGIATEIVLNLTRNTGGFFDSIVASTALADRMKALAEVLQADGR
jgi:hypothetical protein